MPEFPVGVAAGARWVTCCSMIPLTLSGGKGAYDHWEEIRNPNLVDKLEAWPTRKQSKTQQRQVQVV